MRIGPSKPGYLFTRMGAATALGLGVAAAAVLAIGHGGSTPASDLDWSTLKIDPPQYLIHATGHGTTSGSVKDDAWMLVSATPRNGGVELPDGSGGSFGYSIDVAEGPFTSAAQICAAARAHGQGNGTFTPWGWEHHFNCATIAAGSGGGRPNNPNDISGVYRPNNPTGPTGGEEQTGHLTARLDCDALDLTSNEIQTCGIYVSGFRINTSDDVTYTFPTLGGTRALQGIFDVAPGNWSENPSNFTDYGPVHHTNPWHFAKCPQPGNFDCRAAPQPGTYDVPIIVAQRGAGSVRLDLTLIVRGGRGPIVTPPGGAAGGRIVNNIEQPEQRDANGRIIQEAATAHVVACNGSGRQLYIFEYHNRRAFRVIAPPDWSHPIGGREYASFAAALGVACGSAPMETQPGRAPLLPPVRTPSLPPSRTPSPLPPSRWIPPAQPQPQSRFAPRMNGYDLAGENYSAFDLPQASPDQCEAACAADTMCRGYTYTWPGKYNYPRPRCWLKSTVTGITPNPGVTSSYKR